MDISNYIALGTALVAIAGLFWQIWTSNKQSKMQTFLTYTQRYQDIVIHLPIGVESDKFELTKDPKEREDILRWLRSYFDLCSEEYYLNQSSLVDGKVWSLWKAGMSDSLKKPAFIQAWKEIQSNGYYHAKFASFIEGLIQQAKNA